MLEQNESPRALELLAILEESPLGVDDVAALSGYRRRKALDAIDSLIAAMDALDGDRDCEPSFGFMGQRTHLDECEPDADEEMSGDENEPSLGSLGGCYGSDLSDQRGWARGNDRDLEEEHDGREDGGDDEPLLGAPDSNGYQPRWAQGSGDDRERESDYEPSLGVPEGMHHHQQWWGKIGGPAHEDEEDSHRHPGRREGMRLMEAA